ncbi:MAG: hypothetical protein ACREJC_22555, partial [Tepidisphaeraceae bacterium]
MVAIALVLLLMVGVSQIFKITGETVGAGQAISAGTRDARAVQTIIGEDISRAVVSGPFFIIKGQRIAAFRQRADELADRDYQPGQTGAPTDLAIRSIELNNDNVENTSTAATNQELVPRAILGQRNFRIDQLIFFVRGAYRRTTGNEPNTYVANMGSSDALVNYGHLKLPDATYSLAGCLDPGTTVPSTPVQSFNTNPNNFYTSQWVLGRGCVLLRAKDGTGNIYDDSTPPVAQHYINRPAGAAVTSLTPLGQLSTSDAGGYQIQWARYDLAATTMEDYKTILAGAIAAGNSPAGRADNWYKTATGLIYRFAGSVQIPAPAAGAAKISPEAFARIAPVLMTRCSSFIVEFAGDFLEQNAAGQVVDVNGNGTAIESDGELDFVIDPSTGLRRVRW